MSDHRTWLDESSNDGAWQAVCEGCSWSSRWVHADEFGHLLNGSPITGEDLDEDGTVDTDGELTYPGDQAADHAAELGQQHTADNT